MAKKQQTIKVMASAGLIAEGTLRYFDTVLGKNVDFHIGMMPDTVKKRNGTEYKRDDYLKLRGLQWILETGTSSVDAREKLDARVDLFDMICQTGYLDRERDSSGPTVSVEIEALAEEKGCSVAAAQKALRGYTAEQKAKILANPKVQAIAARIKAEREEQAALSLDDML